MKRNLRAQYRRAAFREFLQENAEFADSATTQYIFEQGYLAGQKHEIDNSIAAFDRILKGKS